MSEPIYYGSTSQSIDVFLQDSSSSTGAGLAGLVYNSSGLKCYYRKGATGTATAITLATQTVGGAWSSGGFVEIDSTNMIGVYRLDIPNAAVDSEGFVTLYFYGATNLAPTALRLDCRPYPTDVKRFGGTAGTFSSGRPDVNAAYLGGTQQTGRDIGTSVLLSVGTGTGQVNLSSGKVPATLAAADVSGNPAVNAAQIGGQTTALNANNLLKVSINDILASTLTETSTGYLTAGFKKLFDVATPVLTAASVNQTGDNYARLGAPVGASLSADVASIKTDTGTTILGRLPTSLTSNGNMKTSLMEIIGTSITETSTGYLSAAFKKLLDVSTPVLTAASVNQTGDSYGIVNNGTYGNSAVQTIASAIQTIVSSGSYGNAALLSAIQNVQNNTFIATSIPQIIERPDSGSVTVGITVVFSDETGAAKNLDSGNPTMTLVNDGSTDLSSRLGVWSNPATGKYAINYTNTSTDALEGLHWEVTGTVNSKLRRLPAYTQIVDTTAVSFTSTDRTNLGTILTNVNKFTFDGSNNVHSTPQTGVTVSTNNDKTGYTLVTAPPTAAQVVTAVWQALTSGSDFSTVGSVGALIKAYLDAAISSRSTYSGADTSGTTTLLSRLSSIRAGNLDNLDATISSRSTYAGADTAGTTTLLSRLTDPRALRLDNLDAAISSRSTYAGADTSGTTTLLSRLTSTRALNLDNLDTTVSSRSTYAGTDTSGTTTLLARITNQRATNLDNLNATISSRSTYSGSDTPGTTTLLSRLTDPRATNLDNLDIASSVLGAGIVALGSPMQGSTDVVLAATQPNYAPAKAGDNMGVSPAGLAAIVDSVMAGGDVDGFTVEESLKLVLSVMCGILSGAVNGAGTLTFSGADQAKTRVTAVVDRFGNRQSVTLDAT